MCNVILYGSAVIPVREEIAIRLEEIVARISRWMCKIRLKDKIFAVELKNRLQLNTNTKCLQSTRLL